jgi:hypothetical protein
MKWGDIKTYKAKDKKRSRFFSVPTPRFLNEWT